MRELGLVLVFFGPFLLGLLTAARETAGLKRERGMLLLMLHGEEKIRHSLCPRDELFLDFENEALFRCGFLSALRAGGRTGEAPEKILEVHREALGLDGRVYSCCQRYFSRLGSWTTNNSLLIAVSVGRRRRNGFGNGKLRDGIGSS